MGLQSYFSVNVSKYDEKKCYDIVRPASLNAPKNNAVMFVTEKYIHQADVLNCVNECLVFWPDSVAEIPAELAEKHAIVKCSNPHNAFCEFFRDNKITNIPAPEEMRTVNGAWISHNAVLGENVTVMPGAYVGAGCRVGDNVYIGTGTKLLGDVLIGNNVLIRENTVIGADGLTTDRDAQGKAITMPQFGEIVIEDDVQIGAGVIIARGAIDRTQICRGAKIDNGVFVSHNVYIGEDTFVVGETIFFGSSSTGKRCLISGNATIMNCVHIGDDAVVGAGAVVVKPVQAGSVVKGNPAK